MGQTHQSRDTLRACALEDWGYLMVISAQTGGPSVVISPLGAGVGAGGAAVGAGDGTMWRAGGDEGGRDAVERAGVDSGESSFCTGGW